MMLYEDDLDQELELERERRDEASKAKLFNWLSSDNRGAYNTKSEPRDSRLSGTNALISSSRSNVH